MSKRELLSVRQAAALTAAAGLACVDTGLACYASRIEPEHLTLTHPALEKKPPVRTVFFTDLHLGPLYDPSHLTGVVNAINAAKPELVLFGGDFFACFLKDVGRLPFRWIVSELRRIRAPLGKYAILGNHDVKQGAQPFFELLFQEGGFRVLHDEIVQPAPGVTLCGLSPYSRGKLLKQLPEHGWRVVLSHMPDKAQYLDLKNVDLVLAGHTHGGQVCLPNHRPLILPEGGRLFPYGMYRPQGPGFAQLFVSRGIGMSGLPFRFMAPPEIVILE